MSTGHAQPYRHARTTLLLAAGLLGLACQAATTSKQPLGASCNGDDSVCSSGFCLTVDSGTAICSKPCTKTSECGSNSVCGSTARSTNVCLPIGLNGNCKTDQQCSAGFVCDTDAGRCYIKVDRQACDPCTSSKQCPKNTAGEQGVCRKDGNSNSCTIPCVNGACADTNDVCTMVDGATTPQCIPNNASHTCFQEKGLCEACHADSECGTGASCVRNLASNEQFCAPGCRLDVAADCPNGFACGDLSGVGAGPDVCLPTSRTCSGYCNSTTDENIRRQCGVAATCDLTTRTCQPKTDGSQCAACSTDDNCVNTHPDSVCLENQCTDCPFKGEKFCSAPCSDTNPCGTGYTCTPVGIGGPTFCVPDSGSCRAGAGIVGDDCTALGAAGCLAGLCVSLGASSVCSNVCTTASDCGDSTFICCSLSADGQTYDCASPPATSGGGVCAPRGGGFGADCSLGQPPCAGDLNLLCLNLGTAALCTRGCAVDADCGDGFACRDGQRGNGDGTFDAVKVCFPSGGGAFGANCTFGPAACQSGLCLKKPTGNICTQDCSAGQACPSGFRCVAEELSTGADKTKVCVPNVL
jgi:hypothetical protein